MKRLISITVLIFALVALLCSCDAEKAPDGLQVIHSSSVEGFTFYGPEGWSIINTAYNADCKVYGARLGARGKTSITFIEAEKPVNLNGYFTSSLENMPVYSKDTVQVLKSPEACTFGNSGTAHKAIYTYKYKTYDYQVSNYVEMDFTCMQIFVERGEDFYIFTYTSTGVPSNEDSGYNTYLEYVQKSIDAFVFTDKSGEEAPPTYEKDADGYNLVSDKVLCGFSLYLPEDYKVASNDGDVEAKVGEGGTVSLTRAVDTGVTISDYWRMRKDELSRIVGEINELEVNVVNGEGESKVKLGNLDSNRVAAYTYTYEYAGVTYKVYQVMGVNLTTGFAFTYTAPIDEFDAHFDEIKTILDKVQF